MDRYVARANVDHYIEFLNGDAISATNRITITKLLIAEEDKLSHDLEQLGFAEDRAANGRDRVAKIKRLRNAFALGTTEREQADRLVANHENLQTLLEHFCHHLRARLNSDGI